MSLDKNMEEKTKAYPRSYSTEDLENEVNRLGDMSPDNPALGPGYFAKASLGLIELQGRENRKVTRLVLGVAILALCVSAYGAWLTKRQTNFAEVQSRRDRLIQVLAEKDALEYCKQYPGNESRLLDITSGNPIHCSKILEQYR